ncbi:MAG: efflux RND transporter periplasmic adaptor subunit [Candidatus Aureabacteria bacterium]|nr:efflux RND transporter periplasmic adaptor subunit [Candidatus Auribacterota bacterium]
MKEQAKTNTGIVKKIMFVVKMVEIRMRFIIILLVTALVVGYWDYIQNYYERWQRSHQTHAAHEGHEKEAAQSEFEYFCPMHPFVIRDDWGKCPICGMDLVKRKKGAAVELPEGVIARVQVSPERVMQAGVETEPAAYRLLTHTLRSYGVIELDETRVSRIIGRFPGRVDELMVNAVGLEVKKGDSLARIFSPKFLSATQEYLQALSSQKRVQSDSLSSPEEKRQASILAGYARQRLLLAGFTAEQLDSIEKTGKADDYVVLKSPLDGTVLEKNVLLGDLVEEGTTLYTVADLSTLWVQVQILESDLAFVKVGMPVEITDVSYPGKIFYGTVDFIYPTVNTESRSVKVRIIVSNKEGILKPGMFVNAVIRAPVGRYEVVRSSEDSQTSGTESTEAVTKLAASFKLPTTTEEEAREFLKTISEGGEYYVCPMHPEVVSNKPGDCPKCGMHLEKATKKPEGKGVTVTDAGGKGRWVEGYACPMHIDQLQQEGGICKVCGCGMDTVKWRVEKVLSIPETAVIDTGTRYIVYVQSASGVFDARAVTLGLRSGNYYPVLSGLSEGDVVVARGSFLIDAESRLNPIVSSKPTAAGGQTHSHSEHGG